MSRVRRNTDEREADETARVPTEEAPEEGLVPAVPATVSTTPTPVRAASTPATTSTRPAVTTTPARRRAPPAVRTPASRGPPAIAPAPARRTVSPATPPAPPAVAPSRPAIALATGFPHPTPARGAPAAASIRPALLSHPAPASHARALAATPATAGAVRGELCSTPSATTTRNALRRTPARAPCGPSGFSPFHGLSSAAVSPHTTADAAGERSFLVPPAPAVRGAATAGGARAHHLGKLFSRRDLRGRRIRATTVVFHGAPRFGGAELSLERVLLRERERPGAVLSLPCREPTHHRPSRTSAPKCPPAVDRRDGGHSGIRTAAVRARGPGVPVPVHITLGDGKRSSDFPPSLGHMRIPPPLRGDAAGQNLRRASSASRPTLQARFFPVNFSEVDWWRELFGLFLGFRARRAIPRHRIVDGADGRPKLHRGEHRRNAQPQRGLSASATPTLVSPRPSQNPQPIFGLSALFALTLRFMR